MKEASISDYISLYLHEMSGKGKIIGREYILVLPVDGTRKRDYLQSGQKTLFGVM